MITIVTRLVSRWLKEHPTYGVNVLIPNLNIVLEDDKPGLVSIFNDADDDCVAGAINPTKTPCLVIITDGTIKYAVSRTRPVMDIADVMLSVSYLTKTERPIKARRDGAYALRAVADSLMKLNEPKISTAEWRKLDDMEFLELTELVEVRVLGKLNELRMAGSVVAHIRARRVLD